jgi:hypothetical protein
MSEAAAKELIFALAGAVYRISREYALKGALAFQGRWTSRTMNAGSSMNYTTLNDLYLRYRGTGEIRVRYTGDGGVTWTAEDVRAVANGTVVVFHPFIEGRDVRFEIILPDNGVEVAAYRARLTQGSVFDA